MDVERAERYEDLLEVLTKVDSDLPLYMEEKITAVLPAKIVIEIIELIMALEKNNLTNGIDLYRVTVGVHTPE